MSQKTITNKKIALTGGSTGGHVFPLVSFYNYFSEKGQNQFSWVGEEQGIESELAEKLNIPFFDIPAGRIRRYTDYRNLYEPLKNITGVFFGMYFLLKNKTDIIFSKGGYVALPLCIAGFLLRKKIYIHESDKVSGIVNKLIGKVATKVFYTFPNKLTNDKNNKKHILSGQILNPELLDGISIGSVEENEKLEVLVMGGSQGSTRIFEYMIKLLPDFSDINFTVLLGERNTHFREAFMQFSNVTVHDFLDQKAMGTLLKKTDIAVTRAGATSLFELTAFGIHSIIIPLPESAGNHQQKNANYFKDKYESDIIKESDQTEIELYRKLKKYKSLRKQSLHLQDFLEPLQIIEKELL